MISFNIIELIVSLLYGLVGALIGTLIFIFLILDAKLSDEITLFSNKTKKEY